MKSKRRHELQENVLAHDLVEVKQFLSKYGNWIFGGVAVVGIVVLIVLYARGQTDRRAREEKAQFNRAIGQIYDPAKEASALASLDELAENAKDRLLATRVAGLLGDVYSSKRQASLREGGGEAAEFMAKAKRYYQMVLDEGNAPKPLLASAHVGLGTLAYDAGDVATARAEYEKAVKVQPESPGGLEARRLLSAMEGRSGPVHVVTTLPTTGPATAPATGPAK